LAKFGKAAAAAHWDTPNASYIAITLSSAAFAREAIREIRLDFALETEMLCSIALR
jgi:hypothetical protein